MIGLILCGIWFAVVLAHARWYMRRQRESVTLHAIVHKNDIFAHPATGQTFIVSSKLEYRDGGLSVTSLTRLEP